MNTKDLSIKYDISEQSIIAKAKKATIKLQEFIEIKNVKYGFDLQKQTRGRSAYVYYLFDEVTSSYHKDITKHIVHEDRRERVDLNLSENQKSKIDLKLQIMNEWYYWKREKRGTVKAFIAFVEKHFELKYTYRQHNLWEKAYNKGGANSLIDKRGKEKGSTKLNSLQQRFIIKNFRAFGAGEINYTQLWEDLHKEEEKTNGFPLFEWKRGKKANLCDRGVVKRFIDNYYEKRVIEYTIITKGIDMNKSYNQPAMGNRREQYTYKNECWEIDSTPADVIIFHQGQQIRPDIIAIKDCFSGRCVASVAIKSNSLAIIRLLWKAISTLGIPKNIKGDNGKDYLSNQFQTLLKNIGIGYLRATAFAGDEKGMVERNFRTLQHSYMSVLAGYIGPNIAQRIAIEQQVAKKDRKAKDEFGNAIKTQTASKELLNFEELDYKLEEAIYLWEIDKKRRRGASPVELWNSCLVKPLAMAYEEFLRYAGGYVKRTVQKNGVSFNGRRYISPNIHKYRGRDIFVVENIDDVSQIFIHNEDGAYVGICEDVTISNMNKEAFVKVKKEFNKEVAGMAKEIQSDRLSARSKSSIKDDRKRAKEEHEKGLRPAFEVSTKTEEKIEKVYTADVFKGVVSVVNTDDMSKENISIYSEYDIGY